MKHVLIRASLVIASVVMLSGVSACSKCSVPTFGAMVCSDKPMAR